MIFNNFRFVAALILLALALASCDFGGSSPTPGPVSSNTTPEAERTATSSPTPRLSKLPIVDPKAPKTKVTIALGFTQDVQFAPFYVALNKGYYAEEGLDVTFKHGTVPDLVRLLGAGDEGVNFAVASGDEIIPAHVEGIPVIYVMTWYRQYPVAAVSIEGKGPTLKTPADLKGHTVGVPGPYGSTYTGLLALLKAGGLTLNDITLKSIGFTQVESLSTGQVDVAMGYATNEPVQLRSKGNKVSTLMVSDYAKLASNGLVTNRKTFSENPTLVARVVRATRKGIRYTLNDPAGAFGEALKQVPEAGGANKDLQMKVLGESIKLMQANNPAGANNPIGWTDVTTWSDTQDFLFDSKIIKVKGRIQEMFSNRFAFDD